MQQLNQSGGMQQHGLQTAQPQDEGEKPRYNAVIEYFKAQGYGRYPKKISHRDTNLVATTPLLTGATGTIVTFTVTAGDRWGTYMGIQDVPQGIDRQASYGFGIIAANTADTEVDYFTGVEIQVFDPTTKQYTGVDTIYQEVSLNLSRASTGNVYPVKPKTDRDYFRFEEGAALKGSQQQRWRLVAPDIDVAAANIRYVGTWDLWV
jgi:hypothetical protein